MVTQTVFSPSHRKALNLYEYPIRFRVHYLTY